MGLASGVACKHGTYYRPSPPLTLTLNPNPNNPNPNNPNPNPKPKQMIDHNCKFLDASEERVLKARAGGAARLKRD